MIRYYYVNVDLKNGADVPEKIFRYERDARIYFDSLELSANGIVYKSLNASTDSDGDIILDRSEA